MTWLLAVEEDLKLLPPMDELIIGSISFLLLLTAMYFVVFPKLKAGLAKRSTAIQGKLEDAERTKVEADNVLDEYRKQLADARNEVQKIIDEGRKTADALRAELVAKAEAEAQQIAHRAAAEVAGERDRAISELRQTVGELSLDIATRVIGKELTSKDVHKELVDQAIREISSQSGNN